MIFVPTTTLAVDAECWDKFQTFWDFEKTAWFEAQPPHVLDNETETRHSSYVVLSALYLEIGKLWVKNGSTPISSVSESRDGSHSGS